MVKTLKNIWSIEELRQKILFTLVLVFIYRVGTHIVLPGINGDALNAALEGDKAKGSKGLLDLFKTSMR